MINPIFLKTFLELSRTGSFVGTAKKLNMTQPGVSQHLKKLEEVFGTKLIERQGKSFELTIAGGKLLEYFNDYFNRSQQILESISEDNSLKGYCRFASPGSFGMSMYSFLLELNSRFPELAIHYSYAPNQWIVEAVIRADIDVGFVTKKPKHGNFEVEKFDREEICLIVPSKSNIDSFNDLKVLGFINHPDGFHHGARVLSVNFPNDFVAMQDLKVSGFSNQISRRLDPVALGLGFTALPRKACEAFPNQKAIKYVNLKQKTFDIIYKISRKNRQLPARFEFVFSEYHRSSCIN